MKSVSILLTIILLFTAAPAFAVVAQPGFKTPEAAAKAMLAAWRAKNRRAQLKIAEKEVVKNLGNLIKGSTFQGCTEIEESALKTFSCKIQEGDDDVTAVYFQTVLTRVGYRIMAVDYAAAH